jgi:hypothetical protein
MEEVTAQQIRASSSEHHPQLARTSLGSRDQRPANTVSMYVGLGKEKIRPKQVGKEGRPGSRRSESTHLQRTQHKSLVRYRKLEGNNDTSFSALNPLKEYKRQALRG